MNDRARLIGNLCTATAECENNARIRRALSPNPTGKATKAGK